MGAEDAEQCQGDDRSGTTAVKEGAYAKQEGSKGGMEENGTRRVDLGGSEVLESYIMTVRTPAKPPSLIQIYGKMCILTTEWTDTRPSWTAKHIRTDGPHRCPKDTF